MSKIEEKVEQRLQEAQANKEFKDIGRVSDLKKTKAAYRLIDMGNLSEIEMDEVQAYNIVKKDLVWQPIDVNKERENGATAGAAWLKIKIREAVPTKPDNNKNKRAAYVMFLTKLQGDLAECYNVQQIENLSTKYRKLPLADVISYLLDPTYADKSEDDKRAIEELVKKNYRLAMIYGSERLMSQLVDEVFSKRFANILFNKGDTSYATYKEAKDKEPITDEQSKELIETLEKRKEIFINANRQNQEEYRNYTVEQLKNAMNTKWQLSPMSKQAYKENIESFRTWAIDYYERQIKRGIAEYDAKIEASKPKDNDWSWSEATKEKSEKKSSENKLIINKKEPLAYIKRTGGYKIGEISVNELIDKFGYKAVNYGNYVDDKWSKQHTKFYLQAMSDLGEFFNINIKELNQLGGLGLVFGGKGRAGHAAAYYAQTKDINLTKSNGDGSVGHEYGHYFDNVIIDLEKKKAVPLLATENITQVENEELKQSIRDIIDFFQKGNPLYTPKMKVRFFAQTADVPPSIPFYKDRYWQRKPIEFKPTIDETLEQCSDMLIFDENLYQSQVRVIGYIINHYGLSEYEVDIKLKTSMYYQKSAYNFFSYCYKQPSKYNPNRIEIVKAGDARTKYWTSNVELFARAWETVLFKKILDKNRRSDYLVSGIDLTDLKVEGFQNPYPSGTELDYLETLYDKLIVTVKKVFNLSDFVPYNTEREDTLVEFESKKNSDIKTGVDVTKGKKAEVVNYIENDKVVEVAKEEMSPELQAGIAVEQEHKSTLESVAEGKITPEQAIVETAEEHISENPKYYEQLEKIEKKMYPNIKACLLADGDNENDFIVEGTKIYNNEGVEEWEIVGFHKTGMVLKHNPKTKLSNEKGVKEVSFDELKDMFIKNLVAIKGINGGDMARLNVCIKAIQGCMDKIDAEAYKAILEQDIEKAKKEMAESPSKVDMSEFYKIVREAKDFEDAFKKAQSIRNVNPETSTYFYSKYNPTGTKSGKESFKAFYEEVRGIEKTEITLDLIEKAYNLGKIAHDEEKQRVPAQDKNVIGLLSGLKVGESSKILDSWLKGWDDARENEMRVKFPEMYAPKVQTKVEPKTEVENNLEFASNLTIKYKGFIPYVADSFSHKFNQKSTLLRDYHDDTIINENGLTNFKEPKYYSYGYLKPGTTLGTKRGWVLNLPKNGMSIEMQYHPQKFEKVNDLYWVFEGRIFAFPEDANIETKNLTEKNQSFRDEYGLGNSLLGYGKKSYVSFDGGDTAAVDMNYDTSIEKSNKYYAIYFGDEKDGLFEKGLITHCLPNAYLYARQYDVQHAYLLTIEDGKIINSDDIYPYSDSTNLQEIAIDWLNEYYGKKAETPKPEQKTEFDEAIEMITELLPDLEGEQKQEALDAIEMIKELQ